MNLKRNKFLRKHKEAIQSFYDKAIVDPEIQLMIAEVSKHPEMSSEFHKALDVLYLAMDRMCKEEIKKSMDKEQQHENSKNI